jgi:6-phospho-beta-glucosidase
MTSVAEARVAVDKVAIVGGGGFRVPMIVQALDDVARWLRLDEIVLYDVDDGRAARMELVVHGMRRAAGARSSAGVRRTTDLVDAVDGAGAVLVAIRVGGPAARIVDERVPLELGVLGQETVGPAGIAFAIRTIPVMRKIARVVASRAPTAWFLNFTNPAGVVTHAVRPILDDRVIGICDSPSALRAHVADVLGVDDVDLDHVGLNHLGWAVGVRVDGQDALTDLLADDDRLGMIEEVRLVGVEEVRRLGALPNEYLVYLRRTDDIVATFREQGSRGAVVERQVERFLDTPADDTDAAFRAWRRAVDERHGTYLAEARAPDRGSEERPASSRTSASSLGAGTVTGYGAVAAAFLVATAAPDATAHVLNVANRGRLSFLEDDDVIEATCDVSASGVAVRPGPALPDEAADLVARVKTAERLTIRAAVEGRADLALDAIATHPVVPSRAIAERILARYLADHASLRKVLR